MADGFATTPAFQGQVTVHEWGTFTSVAGENGRAIAWLTLDGPTDLPCFVSRAGEWSSKATMAATVRMETPVIYFYSPGETMVDVRVAFRQGLITEYFPAATVKGAPTNTMGLVNPESSSTIFWRNVRIQPGAVPEFPSETKSNHYYAARATNSAPLKVGADKERFLFYRGIASFALPLAATVGDSDAVVVDRLVGETIPALMLFENRGGRIGRQVREDVTGSLALQRPTLDSNIEETRSALERILVARGLYPREAAAMVETWRDSWFTEGSRLFYIVPDHTVEDLLPLRIDPPPAHVARVFVGRIELATGATLSDIQSGVETGDSARLLKYGRFLRPFAERLKLDPSTPGLAHLQTLMQRLPPALIGSVNACR
jgi:hypothetical protein